MHRKMLSISTALWNGCGILGGTVVLTVSNVVNETDSLNYQNKDGV